MSSQDRADAIFVYDSQLTELTLLTELSSNSSMFETAQPRR